MNRAVRMIMNVSATALALCFAGSTPALAQELCPPGQVFIAMSQAGNGIASMPICQTPYQAPYKRPHPLMNRDPATLNHHVWGAIVEARDGTPYTSFGKLDKKAAVAEAKAECEKHGGGPCRLGIVEANQYMAVTRHNNQNYYGTYRFPRLAVEQAQDKCRKAGGSECGVTAILFSNKGLVDYEQLQQPPPPGAGDALKEFYKDYGNPVRN